MFDFVRSENERLAERAGQRPSAQSPQTDPSDRREPQPADTPDDFYECEEATLASNSASSVTLHRFGTNPAYEGWRFELLGLGKLPRPLRISDEKTGNQRFSPDPGDVSASLSKELVARGQSMRGVIQIGSGTAALSERNTTPLFGSGLIDAIPDAVIEAAAAAQAGSKTFPEIHGRVSRLIDGKIGRFGWKGQMASLEDFVLTACASGWGSGAGHANRQTRWRSKKGPRRELLHRVQRLTSFVAILPAPVERAPGTKGEKEQIAAGRSLFASIGCAPLVTGQRWARSPACSDLLFARQDRPWETLGLTGAAAARSEQIPSRRARISRTPVLESARPIVRSGAPRRCGEFAIPARISTTVERRREQSDRHTRGRGARISAGVCVTGAEREVGADNIPQITCGPDRLDGPA